MNLQEKIAVMQAAAEGKPIEMRNAGSSDPWYPNGYPQWNWEVMEYRAAPPAPREFWVNLYPPGSGLPVAHISRKDADRSRRSDRLACIHVREVVE